MKKTTQGFYIIEVANSFNTTCMATSIKFCKRLEQMQSRKRCIFLYKTTTVRTCIKTALLCLRDVKN